MGGNIEPYFIAINYFSDIIFNAHARENLARLGCVPIPHPSVPG